MISAADVRFLRNLTTKLSASALQSYLYGTRRSTAALILRFGDADSKKVSKLFSRLDANISATDAIDRLEKNQDLEAPSSLELLFIKRGDIREDRWSGRIAFPGGFRGAEDKSDIECLCREVYDEIGFPLRGAADFVYLGKMNDYSLKSRVVSRTGLVQSRFVFLHIGDLTPSVRMNPHHVEAMQWVSLEQIRKAEIERKAVMHVANKFFHTGTLEERTRIQDVLIFDIFFPSVKLPGKWRIWGLTFYNTSELFELAGQPYLCWPLFEVSWPVLKPFAHAMHGIWELQDPTKPRVLKHQMWLVVLSLMVLLVVYLVALTLFTIGIAFRELTLRNNLFVKPVLRGQLEDVELPENLPELPSEFDAASRSESYAVK